MEERMMARSNVNQAPPGTLVKAELKKRPSSVAKGSQIVNTRSQCLLHTTSAMIATILVVINVTRMTHVP